MLASGDRDDSEIVTGTDVVWQSPNSEWNELERESSLEWGELKEDEEKRKL